ncbi:hypothetical protein JCGZ_17851 [Jatropha curcas]|uniref:Uncharacterized protein n=1 Tax=Jatropha curcas TaxID=180498 RepID=A0A067JV51_JATCU|nr:hypothetical protein JCGZ_17851 [Jatropha curcas]
MRRSFGFQQQNFAKHEESWYETEYHSHESSMQLQALPKPLAPPCKPACSPKPLKHQTMIHKNSGSSNFHFNHASAAKMNGGAFNNTTADAEFWTGHRRRVHSPAPPALVVEKVRYEHSTWETDGAQCQAFNENFNWRANGFKNF